MKNYSYEEIFRMLLPKLKKHYPDIEHRIVNDCVDWAFLLSLCYKSGYIRGQFGRSFIIGEPKQTKHWVPATKDNVKAGSKVRMADNILYKDEPLYFPATGTVGTIINIYDGTPFVQWPSGNTSEKDRWFCPLCHLEVLLCE